MCEVRLDPDRAGRVAVECSDNLFTQRSGVITSADFPNPYPKSSDCLYRVELEDGFFITLQFEDSIDIEDHPEVSCPYDYIKVSRLGWRRQGTDPRSGLSHSVSLDQP